MPGGGPLIPCGIPLPIGIPRIPGGIIPLGGPEMKSKIISFFDSAKAY